MSGPIIRSGPSHKFTNNFDQAFNNGAAKTAAAGKKTTAAKSGKSAKPAATAKSAKASKPAKSSQAAKAKK